MRTPVGVLVSETLSSVRSYAVLSALTFALSLSMGVAVVGSTTAEVGEIEQQYDLLQARGSNVWVVRSDKAFEASTCDGLRHVSGVSDAGAPIRQWNATIRELPGASVPVVEATSGYIRIAWNQDRLFGDFGVGAGVSGDLGVRLGSTYTLVDLADSTKAIPAVVSDLLPATKRQRGADQFVTILRPPMGDATECLVEAEPGASSSVEGLLLATFAPGTTISPLLEDEQLDKSPESKLQTRLTLWIPLAVAGVAVLFAVIVHFLRRADWALYRLLGTGRDGVLIMVTSEILITVWLPFAMGVSLAILTIGSHALHGAIVQSALTTDLARAALILVSAPAIAMLAITRSVTNTLKGQ